MQSWEHKLIANVTVSWKQTEVQARWKYFDSPSENTINIYFNRQVTHWIFSSILLCSDTKTWSLTTAYNLEKAPLAASGNKQTAVFGLYAIVWCHVSVLKHDRTPQNNSTATLPFSQHMNTNTHFHTHTHTWPPCQISASLDELWLLKSWKLMWTNRQTEHLQSCWRLSFSECRV